MICLAYNVASRFYRSPDAIDVKLVGKTDRIGAFNDEIIRSFKMISFLHLLLVQNIGQFDLRVILERFEVFSYLGFCLFVFRIFQFNETAQSRGMCKALAVCNIAVFIKLEESVSFKQFIHVEDIVDVALTMVTDDDEVRIIKVSVSADTLQDHSEFLVVFIKLDLCVRIIDAMDMTHRIKIAHLYKHHIRLSEISDEIRSN